MTQQKIKCKSLGDEKIIAIEGEVKILRRYWRDWFDEIRYDEKGKVFEVRGGYADGVKLEHGAKWAQKYQPDEYAIEKFNKAFEDMHWTTFEDALRAVISLCPVEIT